MTEPKTFNVVLLHGVVGSTNVETFDLPPDGKVPETLVVVDSAGTRREYRRAGDFEGAATPFEFVRVLPDGS